MKRRRRGLSDEEQRLWASIARSTTPLKGKSVPKLEEIVADAAAPTVANAAAAPGRPSPSQTTLPMPERSKPVTPSLPPLHPIERPVRRKIGKGRIAIEDRIDLHGQTEATAHLALLFFLRQAYVRQLRHVLVITGRGASYGSTGILKRALPHWFATAEFRYLVAGFEPAERGHGGEGAFYVRLRKP